LKKILQKVKVVYRHHDKAKEGFTGKDGTQNAADDKIESEMEKLKTQIQTIRRKQEAAKCL
jgi:hypothetical protein